MCTFLRVRSDITIDLKLTHYGGSISIYICQSVWPQSMIGIGVCIFDTVVFCTAREKYSNIYYIDHVFDLCIEYLIFFFADDRVH